jgi:hypothetical protein
MVAEVLAVKEQILQEEVLEVLAAQQEVPAKDLDQEADPVLVF